jgi:hypothetical protein
MNDASRERNIGKRIRDFIEAEARAEGLDNDGVLNLLLTVTFAWSGLAGLDPIKNPRALFDRAARVWDALQRATRIHVVEELPKDFYSQKH